MVILSFLVWIIRPELVQGKSGFEGFANQSMLLGALSGISFIYSLYRTENNFIPNEREV